jgi:protein Tob/BTG
MKLELLSASNFLVHLVRLARRNVPDSQLQKFNECLIEVLRRRYRDHWFPEKPFKGSGFRCLRINGKMDPLIGQAGEAAGLTSKFLKQIFPGELTMWIDPLEVSYRIGENGSICVLYEHQEGVSEPWCPTIHLSNKNTSSSSSTQNKNTTRTGTTELTSSCSQDSFRSMSIEQLAAFVSS